MISELCDTVNRNNIPAMTVKAYKELDVSHKVYHIFLNFVQIAEHSILPFSDIRNCRGMVRILPQLPVVTA